MSGHYHGWGDIDPIPPLGAVTDPHLWLLVSFGEGRQSLRKIFLVVTGTRYQPPSKLGVSLRELRNGLVRPSPAVLSLVPTLVPILNSFYQEPVCTGLNPMKLLKENHQPQVHQGLCQPNQVHDNEFARVLMPWNQSAVL